MALPEGRLILGSGRSGTTWVQDCLAVANGLRPVFEPLHPMDSELGRRYAYDVLAGDDQDEQLLDWFGRLSAGSLSSAWIDYRTPTWMVFPDSRIYKTKQPVRRWHRLLRSYIRNRKSLGHLIRNNDTIIKCIRGNLMASWMAKMAGFRVVLVVRHPCAAVESQLRSGSDWDPFPVLNLYRRNNRLHEVTDGAYLDLLNRDLSYVESLTLRWVIENQWPERRQIEDGFLVAYYEELLHDPSTNWSIVCNSLNLKNTPSASLLGRASQQSYIHSSGNKPNWSEPRWKRALTVDQLQQVQGILDATGYSLYDTQSIRPRHKTSDGALAGRDC